MCGVVPADGDDVQIANDLRRGVRNGDGVCRALRSVRISLGVRWGRRCTCRQLRCDQIVGLAGRVGRQQRAGIRGGSDGARGSRRRSGRVRIRGDLAVTVGVGAQAIRAVLLNVRKGNGRPVCLRYRSYAVARSRIRVRRDVGFAVADRVVGGREVYGDRAEPVLAVVRIPGQSLGLAGTDHADLGQVIPSVIQIRRLTRSIQDRGQQAAGV